MQYIKLPYCTDRNPAPPVGCYCSALQILSGHPWFLLLFLHILPISQGCWLYVRNVSRIWPCLITFTTAICSRPCLLSPGYRNQPPYWASSFFLWLHNPHSNQNSEVAPHVTPNQSPSLDKWLTTLCDFAPLAPLTSFLPIFSLTC